MLALGGRQFQIEVQYANVETVLNGVRASVNPMYVKLWMENELSVYMHNQIQATFDFNGRGEGWAPLEESTLRMRREQGITSTDPNYAEGSMYQFLMTHHEVNSMGVISEFKLPGKIDDSIMYYKIHTAQYGQQSADMWGNEANIPARPVLILDQEMRIHIMKMLQIHIMQFLESGLSFANLGSL